MTGSGTSVARPGHAHHAATALLSTLLPPATPGRGRPWLLKPLSAEPGKSAEQILLKQESGVQALLDEAAALGVSRQRILQHLADDTPEARRRAPILERIVR